MMMMNTMQMGMALLVIATAIHDRLLATESAEKPASLVQGPVDLALTFPSPMDGSDQPYRLYLPSAYDGVRAVPMLIALHGTSGNQNTYFDDAGYRSGIYKREAEKRGIAVLCPSGGDALGLPTEWRGVGELHVLAAIDDVCRRFRIDLGRIICSGQSMGGTGTTYLCCRYPDIFAAGIPLASNYGHLSLVTNLRHVPMFYVQGKKDRPYYAETGPIPLTREMQRLGYQSALWMIADANHNTMDVSTERVLDWALQQRLVRHPRHVSYRAYLPLHGRAYWTEIQKIERIGWFAGIEARIEDDNRIAVTLTNASAAALRPEPELLRLDATIRVTVNGRGVFAGPCRADQEIRLLAKGKDWIATIGSREVLSRHRPSPHLIGTVVGRPPNWDGDAETSLGSWKADAMRDATGAEIAICNKGHFRGIPLKARQSVDVIGLVNWLRNGETVLAMFTMRGAELLGIIEDNIRDDAEEYRFFIQVSGCRYRFDRSRPKGQRIVSSDINPAREYSIVCEYHSLARTDTMYLAGRYGKIPFQRLELTALSTAWRYIEKFGGNIEGKLDCRVDGMEKNTNPAAPQEFIKTGARK